MMTPEGKIKAATKKMLEAYGCYQYWPVSNGMGAPALDCIGSHMGRCFAIECKAPGKKPTPRQEATMVQMQKSGLKTFVIDGTEAHWLELASWLEGAPACM